MRKRPFFDDAVVDPIRLRKLSEGDAIHAVLVPHRKLVVRVGGDGTRDDCYVAEP